MAERPSQYRVVCQNRRARFDYAIEETVEAGIILTGTEVKSLRRLQGSVSEAHAGEMGGKIYLFNAHIPEFLEANRFNHEPRRPRLLLLHNRQINKMLGAVQRKGYTLIPLSLYFSEKGIVKVSIGIAKGKRLVDKRATEKERDWQRDKSRIMKNQSSD